MDITGIPTALVDRVEVVTGGASAVYGSDAIAGVVNFILDNEYEGFELGASYDLTTDYGDGDIYSINAKFGVNTADDRGNITVFAGYSDRSAILQEPVRIPSLRWMTRLWMAGLNSYPAAVPQPWAAVCFSTEAPYPQIFQTT